jgi:hypothetical protein
VEDIGVRVELVPMDANFHDISVALYRQDGPVALVHTYSPKPGADERMRWLAAAMAVLGGLERPDGALVAFPCGTWHEAAAKRIFLEACKLDPTITPTSRPLELDDPKTGQHLRAEPAGDGTYRIVAEGVESGTPSRAPAVAAGLAKLGQLDVSADDAGLVTFPAIPHDDALGWLLPRAQRPRRPARAGG